MTQAEVARVTTVVALDPARAFEVFTAEIGSWWKSGPRYRFNPEKNGTMRFEPRVGGRLVEVHDPKTGAGFEVGRVLIWEPGARLVFEFRGRDFAPGERTEVEVRFETEGAGTRLTVEHRGWESIRPGHPARHGFTGPAFADMIGLWWADLLVSIRDTARRSP
jgi:activator of Hsp90 ATPase-like protein